MKSEVLILGGGLSAYAAAWEAVLAGAKVDLFSDGAGASPFIHGICVPIGEDDSTSLYEKDTILAGCKQNDPELVHIYCQESAKIPEYLSSLGLSPDKENGNVRLLKPLGASSPRVLSVENSTGPTIMRELKHRLIESGKFTAHSGCRAVELLTENSRVVGAKIYDRKSDSFFFCGASATILATGGFCRLFPETTTPPDLGGDGIAMASRVGAKLCDMEYIQFEPCSAVAPDSLVGKSIITTLFYEGAVLRNRTGERFLLRYGPEGECLQKDVLSLRMAREILSGGGGPCGGLFFDCTDVPTERMRGVYAPYRDRYLSVGIDLEETPVEVAPAAHTSLGGIKIDKDCCTGVSGLVACGEVTGGLHGANRLGGNAGTETIVFGRIAGRSAAKNLDFKSNTDLSDVIKNKPSALDIPAQRKKLGMLLQNGLGVIRSEQRMLTAIDEVEEMLSQPLSSNCFEELRLKNDLITAHFALKAALKNKKSIGCHYIDDTLNCF